MVQLYSLPSRLLLVYGTLLFLFPKFLIQEKYIKFINYFVLLLLFCSVAIQRSVMLFFVQGVYLPYKSEQFFKVTELMNVVLDVNLAAVVPIGYAFFEVWRQSKEKNAELEQKRLELLLDKEDEFIYLKEGSRLHKVFLKDILFIESLKNYIRVKSPDKEIVCYRSISSIQEVLPEEKFLRVHRSFIISIHQMDTFSPNQVNVKGHLIPIGRKYKERVKEVLGYF